MSTVFTNLPRIPSASLSGEDLIPIVDGRTMIPYHTTVEQLGSALGGGGSALTAAQQAVFDALGIVLPNSAGPLGAPIVVRYTATSPVTFVQAIDLACTLASTRTVNFEIDGIIPAAAIAANYEQFLYGNLSNLSIIGRSSNNSANVVINSVVSCAAIGGGRFDLVLQAAAALPAFVRVGGMFLFNTGSAALLPNASWRGIAGAYLVKAVNTGLNQVTLDVQNDVAITVGPQVLSPDFYCGNVLPNVLFRVVASVRQMSGFGINGGSLLLQTGADVRADGFLAVIPGGGLIAFDIGGAFGGYVNSLRLYAGTRLANGATRPYTVMENPGSTSLVNLAGVFANNFDHGFNPHDGAQLVMSSNSALTNMAVSVCTALSFSDVYISEMRLHNTPLGFEVFAGGKVYIGTGVEPTSVTALYSGTVGTLRADGSGIFTV